MGFLRVFLSFDYSQPSLIHKAWWDHSTREAGLPIMAKEKKFAGPWAFAEKQTEIDILLFFTLFPLEFAIFQLISPFNVYLLSC